MAAKPFKPLLAVIGATGTGKSELAVELARRFNGEIINGDAMQLYRGLPIITNQIPIEERKGIPHHLLSCIGLHEQTWVVGTFVNRARTVIEDVHARGKLPILVGGTNYYTQSLLFSDGLATQSTHETNESPPVEPDLAQEDLELLQQPTEVLLAELKKIDPIMADRWHPNDRRKIQRSLEIYLRSGQKASELYAEQRRRKEAQVAEVIDGNAVDVDRSLTVQSARYPFLVFWVDAENETLRSRLDSRVEKMIQRGLVDEVSILNAHLKQRASDGDIIDETRGIWVSIGYKEFKEYSTALGNDTTSEQDLRRLKDEAIEKTKIATRQYAKRQIRWIRIKLVNALAQAEALNRFFILDSTNIAEFENVVVQPAINITEHFLEGTELPTPASVCPTRADQLLPRREFDLSANPEKWQKQHCEVCSVTCVTPDQWEQHTRSKAHKKASSKARLRMTGEPHIPKKPPQSNESEVS